MRIGTGADFGWLARRRRLVPETDGPEDESARLGVLGAVRGVAVREARLLSMRDLLVDMLKGGVRRRGVGAQPGPG